MRSDSELQLVTFLSEESGLHIGLLTSKNLTDSKYEYFERSYFDLFSYSSYLPCNINNNSVQIKRTRWSNYFFVMKIYRHRAVLRNLWRASVCLPVEIISHGLARPSCCRGLTHSTLEPFRSPSLLPPQEQLKPLLHVGLAVDIYETLRNVHA